MRNEAIDQKRLGFPGTRFDLILPLFDLGTDYLFLHLLSVGGGGHWNGENILRN